MKRPGLYFVTLFVSIILSTVIVSTIISGVARSFYKSDMENVNVKTTPSFHHESEIRQVSNTEL